MANAFWHLPRGSHRLCFLSTAMMHQTSEISRCSTTLAFLGQTPLDRVDDALCMLFLILSLLVFTEIFREPGYISAALLLGTSPGCC